jgi:hypothetical protein
MASTFRPAEHGERASITRFLQDVFHATGGEPGLSAPQMQWKYEDPAAPHAWSCRNFVIERDGRVLAHAGVWPVHMLFDGERYSGAHLIDWAGAQDAPGAGVSLLQKIGRAEQVIYGLGGSEMTRKIFPTMGFRPLAKIGYYARPVRPWRQIHTHQWRRQWKAPVRLARNAWWSRRPAISLGQWSARASDPGENPVWPSPRETAAVCARDAGGFRYLARCPVMRTAFYTLRNGPDAAGYFLLAFVPGQARIADAWTPSDDPQDWQRLFALAEAEALRNPEVAEITTIASLPAALAALPARGFRRIKEEDLMAYDPKRILPAVNLHFQLVDNDACYLHDGSPLYLT